MQNVTAARNNTSLRLPVILAGLAGGMIEVAWIWLYGSFASVSPANIARQITYTLLPHAFAGNSAVLLGVGIHLALSIALAVGFVAVLYGPIARRYGAVGIFASGLTTLSAVWAVNFLVILPALNPGFPALMPYAVTLVSKLLFGAAMSWVLIRGDATTRRQATIISR